MSPAVHVFSEGGAFMYVLLMHLLVWLLLSWGYLVFVIVRAFRIRSRAGRFEAACDNRDFSSALRDAEAKPHDPVGRVVGLAARGLLNGWSPEEASAAAYSETLRRIPGLHPLWGVSCCIVFTCCVGVTLFLGSMGEHVGLVRMFEAIFVAAPEYKAELFNAGTSLARYPVMFSIIISVVTGIPAAAAALLLATVASSGRERRLALALISKLTGKGPSKAPGSTGGLAGGALLFILLLIAAVSAVFPSGVSEKIQSFMLTLDQDVQYAQDVQDVQEEEYDAPENSLLLKILTEEENGARALKSDDPEDKPPEEAGENSQVMGSLSKKEIEKVIKAHLNEIKYCHEKNLAVSPPLSKKIVVKFIISPKGNVKSAQIASSTAGDKELESCIVKAVLRWKFPPPKGGGVVVVNYPFVFKTAE